MKKELLSTLVLGCLALSASGQTVTETVNFDTYQSATNNDLTARFVLSSYSNAYTPNLFTQTTTGGITGGGLVPINEPNFGNDYANYCSTYRNTLGVATVTSVCFKYNSSSVNPNSSARPIVIYLNPQGNPTEYLDFSLTKTTLFVAANNYAQSTNLPAGTLVTGNWYKVVATYQPIGGTFNDQYAVRLELFDLGVAGTATPISKAFHTATIYRANIIAAPSFTVGIAGAKWGGADLLDNFSFTGQKGSALCAVLATKAALTPVSVSVFPNPASSKVTVQLSADAAHKPSQITIFDLLGKVCHAPQQWNSTAQQMSVDVANLKPGLYTIRVRTVDSTYTKNFVIE